MRSARTTRDPVAAKRERVVKALRNPGSWVESNRDLGEKLGVDEKMVRKYRELLKVPKLLPGTGQPVRRKRKYRAANR
jgi:hypothetical protein